MTLTFWQIIIILSAGAAMVALGAIIAGFFVYKTKYAGHDMFHMEHVPQGEAFNIEDDFTEDPLNLGVPEEKELPEEIQAANDKFLKQFNMKRLVEESEKYAEH
jgi:NAD(P)H-dependent FMN reductase